MRVVFISKHAKWTPQARVNHGYHEGYYFNQGPGSYTYGYNAGSYGSSGQSSASKSNQFRVYILPQQLEGIKLLW